MFILSYPRIYTSIKMTLISAAVSWDHDQYVLTTIMMVLCGALLNFPAFLWLIPALCLSKRSCSDSSLTVCDVYGVCVCVCMCVCVCSQGESSWWGNGGQIQCPVVSLAQHGSFHLLPDPHAHITWTDGHCFFHFVTLSDLCVFLQSNQPFKFAQL